MVSSPRNRRHQRTQQRTQGNKGTPTNNTTDKPLHSALIGLWQSAAGVACSCNAMWCGLRVSNSRKIVARYEIWDDWYPSVLIKKLQCATQLSRTRMTSPSNLPSQHPAPTCGLTRPPRPRCGLRSALRRLRPSAEAPHGRQTTTLRRGFVPVGSIAVGGCGSRAEPSIRARAPGKAEKYIERRLNAVPVTPISTSRLNGARCTPREHLRPLTNSTCINHPHLVLN